MTYSTGPGGYGGPPQGPSTPGYGPPAPGYGAAPAPGEGKGLPFFLHIGVIALGVISFFRGSRHTSVVPPHSSAVNPSR